MRRPTIDIIRDAHADIDYYKHLRVAAPLALVAVGIVAAVLGFTINEPYLLGKLFRMVGGGLFGVAIVVPFAITRDIRAARRVISDAESGHLSD